MTSDKQIAANRENAKKAGVRTDAGKAVSRRNALKHGILSSELIIEHDQYTEDRELFHRFRRELFEELQPVGMIEMMHVDRLLTLYWRMRRVAHAERAMIERSMTETTMASHHEETQKVESYADSVEEKYRKKVRSSLTHRRMLEFVWVITALVEAHGLPLTGLAKETVEEELGFGYRFRQIDLIVAANNAAETAQKKGDEKAVKQETKDAQKALASLERLLEMRIALLEKWELEREVKDIESKLIPSEQEAERIQRYESNLHRMFLQTLHELQRLQSVRLGKPAPMSAALDVTVSNENGFVS